MAINKKLIHFKTKSNFNSEVAKGNILDTSIVFIKDSKEIHTHGETYKSVNWSVLEKTEEPVTPNLITFTIEDGTYWAEEGMIWAEWVDTKYNIIGIYNVEGRYKHPTKNGYLCDSMFEDVDPSDIIINGQDYYID